MFEKFEFIIMIVVKWYILYIYEEFLKLKNMNEWFYVMIFLFIGRYSCLYVIVIFDIRKVYEGIMKLIGIKVLYVDDCWKIYEIVVKFIFL